MGTEAHVTLLSTGYFCSQVNSFQEQFEEMDCTKIFEVKPSADDTNPLEELAKVVIIKKKAPELI